MDTEVTDDGKTMALGVVVRALILLDRGCLQDLAMHGMPSQVLQGHHTFLLANPRVMQEEAVRAILVSNPQVLQELEEETGVTLADARTGLPVEGEDLREALRKARAALSDYGEWQAD
jgi:hypothetical protein